MKQNSLLDQLRRVLSILLNLAVVRMEPIAIRMSWEAVGEQALTFYTENSNLFSAAVCLLVAVCQLWALLSGRALPRWVKRLKFIAACCLTLTFLTVVFVLAPYYPDEGGVVFLLTESSMLYHHLLNPVLVFVSFVFLEREPRLPARNIPLALVPTVLYGVYDLWGNITGRIDGPYPFMRVYDQTLQESLMWFVIILGTNLLYALLLWWLGGNGRKHRKKGVGLEFVD